MGSKSTRKKDKIPTYMGDRANEVYVHREKHFSEATRKKYTVAYFPLFQSPSSPTIPTEKGNKVVGAT